MTTSIAISIRGKLKNKFSFYHQIYFIEDAEIKSRDNFRMTRVYTVTFSYDKQVKVPAKPIPAAMHLFESRRRVRR